VNYLYLGDCLEVLKNIASESIDVIYLDPPFFSNRNYEIIWGDTGEIRSFQDRWSGGIDHYIAWLKERVQELYRVLKSTGSIFLHCDWHANAYIRVYILDKIFGDGNFQNEMILRYTAVGLKAKSKKFHQNTETIFYYVKKKGKHLFNDVIIPAKPRIASKHIFNPITKKAERLRNEKGEIEYFEIAEQKADNFIELPALRGNEKIGYPTQKPEALLERIIKCASNEGGIILDPFVGGGTTVAVADRLNRQWIGIDQSVSAVKLTELRLYKQQDLFSKPFVVQLHKYDYDTLRYKDAFEFETWIVGQFGGIANTKQRGDLGMDGRTRDGKPIQVKRSDNIGRNVIDNFVSACKRYDKTLFEQKQHANESVGVIIAFSFGKGAVQEVARLKNEENIIIQLVTVEEIIPIAKKPILTVEFTDLGLDKKQLREIEFVAIGESAAGIEFYSWDWNYNEQEGIFKPEMLRDKEGKQTQKFKAGSYCIAVKVVDNDGLESLEIIKLKVNGHIEKTN
jgi:DNA modification methylase